MASEAEQAAARGQISKVYKVAKRLCNPTSRQTAPIKSKDGTLLTTESEQANRWVQHFCEVLNQDGPPTPAAPTPPQEQLDINCDPPTEEEILTAIKKTRNGKAPGIDGIQAEMLKADLTTSTKVLKNLFDNIWLKDKVPRDWCKGLIVKIPKKGDLRSCDNWRGVTLLSIPSKVFCSVLLRRIDKALDSKLREEQAGFRRGRGCMDQVFALRNIIEQCLEWKSPLYINFIDFKKAFDSVHRESLWRILASYGIPPKMIGLINAFYHKFECSVILENTISEPFSVDSGVRQGCILSPILFLVAIDWIMRQTTSDRPRGIQWTPFTQLEDLDFADDLALMSSKHDHLKEKSERLNCIAKQVGLNINMKKTQVMTINSPRTTPIHIEGEDLACVESFTYLGSVVGQDSGAEKDIQARLGKASGAFSRLQPIWKSKQLTIPTKVKLYNSNVKSVLLYGAECWRVTKRDMSKIEVFHHRCLRKLCGIFWPNKISNNSLYQKTGSRSIVQEIQERRFRWLGHVLRMPPERITKNALRWTPPGKRRPGRPKTT